MFTVVSRGKSEIVQEEHSSQTPNGHSHLHPCSILASFYVLPIHRDDGYFFAFLGHPCFLADFSNSRFPLLVARTDSSLSHNHPCFLAHLSSSFFLPRVANLSVRSSQEIFSCLAHENIAILRHRAVALQPVVLKKINSLK